MSQPHSIVSRRSETRRRCIGRAALAATVAATAVVAAGVDVSSGQSVPRPAAMPVGSANAPSGVARARPGAIGISQKPALAGPGAGELLVGGPFQTVVYDAPNHLLIATPGDFREGELRFQAPSIRYNERTHQAWSLGLCTVTRGDTTAHSSAATADFSKHEIALNGGVQFQVRIVPRGQGPVRLAIGCPVAVYRSTAGEVSCTGPVMGVITGLSTQPGSALSALPQRAATARAAPAGPVLVHAGALQYALTSRQLRATAGVILDQGDTRARCRELLLDVDHQQLEMIGEFGYTDASGRRLEGSQATEALDRQTVLVTGPVTYADRSGNTIRAGFATLDRRANLATFSSNVQFTDAHGSRAQTPFVSIQTGPGGAQTIQTGPLRLHGTAG